MNVGLIDVDNWDHLENSFPNLPLMKISAWHKRNGDQVEWMQEFKHYDKVYLSKVFSFTPDYPEILINADEINKGGSGYAIRLQNGKEIFDAECHKNLADEIEHMYPDYSLYGITDTAYGFMSRGCPRGCFFCHVAAKEGQKAYKVADLSEFWSGQKNIEIMDPNTLACPDWKDILQQLIDSHARVEFNQGVDIRLMTDAKCEMLMQINLKLVHFAWDRYQDKDIVLPKFEALAKKTGWDRHKVSVYILTNFDTTIEQDIERVETIKSLGFMPYVMRYDKEHIPRGHILNKLARYANTSRFHTKCPSFEYYLKHEKDFH